MGVERQRPNRLSTPWSNGDRFSITKNGQTISGDVLQVTATNDPENPFMLKVSYDDGRTDEIGIFNLKKLE